MASIGIGDEDLAAFEGDLNTLAGLGALVEQVEARFRIVGWNPFADGLPRQLRGISNDEFQMSKLRMSGRSRTR